MQFSEIEVRNKVVITVTNGGDMQARFVSQVMKNGGSYILTIPFKHKGVRINFEGRNVRIHMEVRDGNGMLWTFRNCKIEAIMKNGLIYHKMSCSMMNGIENRRGGRRFYIWESVVVHSPELENSLFTKMKDIGPIGFSFVIDNKKNIELKEGIPVNCTIKNNEGEELELEGMIVRHEVMEKYVVYGCKMENPSDKVLAYVRYLERKNFVVDAEL